MDFWRRTGVQVQCMFVTLSRKWSITSPVGSDRRTDQYVADDTCNYTCCFFLVFIVRHAFVLVVACSVVLDIPLGVFMTMFGYPPSYLFSDEMRRVLRKAEKLKQTVRQSPSELALVFVTSVLNSNVLVVTAKTCT